MSELLLWAEVWWMTCLLFRRRVFRKWSVDKSGLKVEAVFLVEGQSDIVPFSFRVEHNGE